MDDCDEYFLKKIIKEIIIENPACKHNIMKEDIFKLLKKPNSLFEELLNNNISLAIIDKEYDKCETCYVTNLKLLVKFIIKYGCKEKLVGIQQTALIIIRQLLKNAPTQFCRRDSL
jgi:hypothetical protein